MKTKLEQRGWLPGVIFCDIDGTLLEHKESFMETASTEVLQVLPGVMDKIYEWHCRGFKIIITTARPECTRDITVRQLKAANIVYDTLIMGIGLGPRYLINDNDPKDPDIEKAVAFAVPRNGGLAHVEI